ERGVLAGAGADRFRQFLLCPAVALGQPCRALAQTVGVLARRPGQVKRGPAKHRRRDVAEALDRVAPTAVGVLVRREPVQSASNEGVERAVGGGRLLGQRKGANGGRGGQGGGRQLPNPIPFGRALSEEGGQRGLIGGFETLTIQRKGHWRMGLVVG